MPDHLIDFQRLTLQKNKRRPSLTHTQVLHLIIQSFTALIEENGRGQASGMRPVTKTSGSLVDTKINNCFFFLKKKKLPARVLIFFNIFFRKIFLLIKKKKKKKMLKPRGVPTRKLLGAKWKGRRGKENSKYIAASQVRLTQSCILSSRHVGHDQQLWQCFSFFFYLNYFLGFFFF